MGIMIGAKPDSGFDDPIGMLKDCHRRIEHFLNILCIVVERARGRALNDEETAAVQSSLQYFRLGGKRHNADEEESLFPRIRQSAGEGDFTELGGLEEDHQTADRLHTTAEILYERWIASGTLNEEEQQQLASATQNLKQLYSEHIRTEEQVVFPRAAQMLDKETVRTIGNEFRQRRA